MQYAVLGPVEVEGDAGRIPLGGKQHVVTAALLCRPNQAVSTDVLIDLLWPDDPPATARNSLQVYVYRLRKALGSDSLVSHTAAGYTLLVQPGELDVYRFEEAAAAGRQAMADGMTEDAAKLWQEALDLWRGEAFAGTNELTPIREEAARLEELRLATLEHRFEAELALGRHTRSIPELTALSARHPLRDRFRYQLMLALYRSGRRADALQVYREGRELVRAELGLEPGHDLRRLELDILRGDAALDLPSQRSALQAPPVLPAAREPRPAELPAGIPTFVGRHAELTRISNLLRASRDGDRLTVIAINGVGGIGKSSLAVEVARGVAEEFPDGQLYVNLHGATPGVTPLNPDEVLDRLLRAVGDRGAGLPTGTEEATARFRTLTAGRRLLIVLDDAVDAAQVRPLLPGGPGCAVLITSRDVLTALDGATHVRLNALGEAEGVDLLSRLAGVERVGIDTAASLDIVRLCGCLPLAISIAGARLAARDDWTPALFAKRLGRAHRRLDELEHADLAVRASFTLSLDQLRRDVRRGGRSAAALFPLLGLLETPSLSVAVVAALADRPEEEVEDDLDVLVGAQLLQALGPDRFEIHDLVRLYARELAWEELPEADRAAAVRRALHHYLATIRIATGALVYDGASRRRAGLAQEKVTRSGTELTGRPEASAWLGAEVGNLLAITRQAAAAPDDGPEIAIGLAAALNGLGNVRHFWRELVPINQLILEVARTDGRTPVIALAHADLGRSYRLTGQLDDAVANFEAALDRWRRVGDRTQQGHMLFGLGATAAMRGRLDEAVAFHREALEIRREQGDPFGEAHMLHVIAVVLTEQQAFEEALGNQRQSLALFHSLGDAENEGMVLASIAELHHRRGDAARAVPLFERALRLIRSASDQMAEAGCLWRLGTALISLGRPGRDRQREALAILQDLRALTADEVRAILRDPQPGIPRPLKWL
ncbi:tetratricopeptide repeat protein [Kribbella sp. NBC_01245]|uniref:AfsR/SARP family transcriptional regulator n=1 Tax=Kribbella sp. NBC_01245 TaxID=2903578 RepID=UPI002E2D0177|nr:BTAD domain-containing putative transcriptional regulator [Kribbella sp. NBC_01245]